MIVCTVPFPCIKYFEDVVDGLFYYLEEVNLKDRKAVSKPLWLLVEDEKADYISLLPSYLVSSKVRVLAKEFELPTVGVWDGKLSKKLALLNCCNYIALDRKCRYMGRRGKNGLENIYYGFKNLDELKILPPFALITSTPIKAALSGILLSDRERRPKSMPKLTPWTSMTKPQIELARKNILLIKEAAGWK